MFDNTKYPYPVIFSLSNNTCLCRDIHRVCTNRVCSKIWTNSKIQQIHSLVELYPDTNNIQSTTNPLSSRSTHCIQMQTISKVQQIYSLVENQTLYTGDSNKSSKTQLPFLIESEYYVHLWSDVQHVYTAEKFHQNQ